MAGGGMWGSRTLRMGEGRGAIGVGKAPILEGIVLSWVGVVWAVVGAGVPDVGLGAVDDKAGPPEVS